MNLSSGSTEAHTCSLAGSSGGLVVYLRYWRRWLLVTIVIASVLVDATVAVGHQVRKVHHEVALIDRSLVETKVIVDDAAALSTRMDRDNSDQNGAWKDSAVVNLPVDELSQSLAKPRARRTQRNCLPSLRRRTQEASCSPFKRLGTSCRSKQAARNNCFAKLTAAGCDKKSACGWSRDEEFWRNKTKDWAVQCYCGNAGAYIICA